MKSTKIITEEEFNAMYPNLLAEKNPFTLADATGFLKALDTIYGDDSPEWIGAYLVKILLLMTMWVG